MSILPVAPDQYDRHNEQITRTLLEERIGLVERSTATTDADDVLQALSDYNTNGLLTQTAEATFTGRTITGTASEVQVTNGDGVSGNPTIGLPDDVAITTSLTLPNTGLHLLDTNASHDLIIKPGSNLTADKTLTLTTGDNDRTLDISAASVTVSSYMAGVLDDADEATFKATTNLEIGTDVQAYNARLADVAGAAWAQGDVLYYNGTNLVRLAAGTANYVLKTGGAGANPAWAGAPVLLTSGAASGATLDIVLTSYTGWRAILFRLALQPATDAVDLYMRVSTDGGSSYDAGVVDYQHASMRGDNAGTLNGNGSAGSSVIVLSAGGTIGNAANERIEYKVELLRPETATTTGVTWSGLHVSPTGALRFVHGSGLRATAQNTDAVRFLFSAGDISSGEYAVYGLP